MTRKIGVIGVGTIATAVVRGLAADGHQITISQRGAANAALLRGEFETVTVADNQSVLDHSDIVILGLMAAAAPDILADLSFRPDQQVLSLMAGMALDRVAELVAPAAAKAIMLPYPGIATGGSPILLQGDPALADALFGARNRIFVLDDPDQLNAYLCAQAVLSPVARMVSDAAKWLGTRVEDHQQGEEFLRMLVTSGLADSTSDRLIAALNTPGGYNQRLRIHMEDSGMGKTLVQGLDELARGR